MLKYLLPVLTLSAAFNVTKFLEATYDYGKRRKGFLNMVIFPDCLDTLKTDLYQSSFNVEFE